MKTKQTKNTGQKQNNQKDGQGGKSSGRRDGHRPTEFQDTIYVDELRVNGITLQKGGKLKNGEGKELTINKIDCGILLLCSGQTEDGKKCYRNVFLKRRHIHGTPIGGGFVIAEGQPVKAK